MNARTSMPRIAALGALLIACAFGAPATALTASMTAIEPRIGVALTVDEVRVTARFSGEKLAIFGVAHGLLDGDDLVVVLRGPERPLMVMRKERRFGLWLPGGPARVEGAPSFFATVSTRPLTDITTPDVLARLSIGADHAPLRAVNAQSPEAAANLARYRQAIRRLKSADDLYLDAPGEIDFFPEGLFRAQTLLPAGAPTGAYRADAYLFRRGRVIAQGAASLPVARAGLERAVYDFAHGQPLAYGLLTLAIAGAAGWGAAAAFRRR